MDNAMCQRSWDQMWRLQQATFKRVQSEPMVSWSALEKTATDNVMYQRIWDQLWKRQLSHCVRVQSEPMISWFALEKTTKDSAMCQHVCEFGQCDVAMEFGPFWTEVFAVVPLPSHMKGASPVDYGYSLEFAWLHLANGYLRSAYVNACRCNCATECSNRGAQPPTYLPS